MFYWNKSSTHAKPKTSARHKELHPTGAIKMTSRHVNIGRAYSRCVKELRLDLLRRSLKSAYSDAIRTHDAIHLLLLVAPNMFPRKEAAGMKTWQHTSTFLTYHWDIFDMAHCSLYEALRGNYSASFILLRATVELLVRGAFFECLAHQRYRDTSHVLDEDTNGRRLKGYLSDRLLRQPALKGKLEEISATLLDIISDPIDDPKLRPSLAVMLRQLNEWKILDGLSFPDLAMSHVYQRLSKDVHAHPDRTDMGRVLTYSSQSPFGPKKVMRHVLMEYLSDLRQVLDASIVVTLNVLRDNLDKYHEIKQQVLEVALEFDMIDLDRTSRRLAELP
jgi:hypothetical protein